MSFLHDPLTEGLLSSSQCPVSPPVSQWILIVRPTPPSCLGMPVRARLSILPAPNLWMEMRSTVTALPPSAPSKAWNVVTFTISRLKPLTAFATARIVNPCRWEQVTIRAQKSNYHSSQLTVLQLVNSASIHFYILYINRIWNIKTSLFLVLHTSNNSCYLLLWLQASGMHTNKVCLLNILYMHPKRT